MAVIGEVYELDADTVSDSVIAQLKYRMDEKLEASLFDCSFCGAERKANIIDPGSLLIRDYKCADVGEACQSPLKPKATKRPVFLVPGSLVSCRLSENDSAEWPGIIEDCPDGTDIYIIRGKTPNTVKAYFVTFIFPKTCDREWIGGYIAAGAVFPYQKRDPPPNATSTYRKSLKRANAALNFGRRRRLLEFSFVADVASRRKIRVETFHPKIRNPSVWKRKASPCRSSIEDYAPVEAAAEHKRMPELPLKGPQVPQADELREQSGHTSGTKRRRLYLTRKILLPRPESSD